MHPRDNRGTFRWLWLCVPVIPAGPGCTRLNSEFTDENPTKEQPGTTHYDSTAGEDEGTPGGDDSTPGDDDSTIKRLSTALDLRPVLGHPKRACRCVCPTMCATTGSCATGTTSPKAASVCVSPSVTASPVSSSTAASAAWSASPISRVVERGLAARRCAHSVRLARTVWSALPSSGELASVKSRADAGRGAAVALRPSLARSPAAPAPLHRPWSGCPGVRSCCVPAAPTSAR